MTADFLFRDMIYYGFLVMWSVSQLPQNKPQNLNALVSLPLNIERAIGMGIKVFFCWFQ